MNNDVKRDKSAAKNLERLDKIISSQGMFSRSDIKRLIRKGEVMVDGTVVKNSATKIHAKGSTITVSGKKLAYNKYIYIMINKPVGVLSAARDNKTRTVLNLLSDDLLRPGLFPVGRLDKDTTGLIIVTDDGNFAHRVMAPKNNIIKTYHALVSEAVTESDVEAFDKGISLADGTVCKSAKLSFVYDEDRPNLFDEHIFYNSKIHNISKKIVEISICEGKYHQVKRMFGALGNNVEKLHRISIGSLKLCETLKDGEVKQLSFDQAAESIKKC